MKKVVIKKINILEQVKIKVNNSKPIWKTGTCKDKNLGDYL